MDDAALVLQAVAGDQAAFAAIYDRFAAPLYDFLCSVVHDRDEAADVLHDTFLTAGSRLHQLRDPAKLRPWLYAIARHHGWRRVKHRSRFEPLDEDHDVTAATPDAADLAARGELTDLVQAAAAGLNPRDRIVLDLHLRQGLEGEELGDALGVSASHAYVLMSRLRDQVERSLGALLVARQGRKDCPELAAVLAGWDGAFSAVWRKRVARHADGCSICGETRKRAVGALALLAAAPAAALPLELRDRVLADVQLVSYHGTPWRGGRDGFPPPSPRPERRPRRALAALLALLALLVAGLAALDDDDTEAVSAAAPSATFGTPTTSASSTSAPSAPASASIPDPVVGPISSATVSPSPTTQPTETPTTVTTTPVDTTPAPSPTSIATTAPPDTTPPDLTAPRVDPGQVRAGSSCTNTDPRQTTVTVIATDESGLRSVVLIRGAPEAGQTPMVAGVNGRWTVTIGPFAGASLTRNNPSATVSLTVRATDAAGNTAESRSSLIIRCDFS